MLITAVKDEEPLSVNKLASKNYQVYVIEDSTPPTNFQSNDEYTPLPSTVEFGRIVANVIASLNSSYFKQIKSKK